MGENCYGEEKLKRLKQEYSDFIINEFYSDSLSDSYLAEISKKSFIVDKKNIYEWKFNRK